MRKARLITTLATAGALTLAGCASPADDATSQATVTSTVEDIEAPVETASPTPTSGTTTPTEETPAADLPMEPVGSEITIAGEPATVCIYGDGWGTNVWAGNANTSCEFVSEVHHALIDDLDPTRQNIREFLKPEITVTSPVTGQAYEMTCAARDERLLSCTGGEEATVYFY